jgi:cytochrome c biogenesis protein CcmG/thiol:disulfide interchange protein DsbE
MTTRKKAGWMYRAGIGLGVGLFAAAAGLTTPASAQSGTEQAQPSSADRGTESTDAERARERGGPPANITRRQQTDRTQPRGVRDADQDAEREARTRAREQAARERAARQREVANHLPIARLEDAPRAFASVDPEWREPMPSVDRTMMDALIGYAAPEFPDNVSWHGHNPPRAADHDEPSWLQFRDRIVVVQSWTSVNRAGRQAMTDAITAVSEFSANDVALILVHTPEGHQGAKEFVEHASKPNVSIVVDPVGEWCEEVGIYRTPVNFVVDRNGEVRFGALSPKGIVEAVNAIIDEEYDEHSDVESLPPMSQRLNVAFPNTRGSTGNTPNIQGEIGPDVYVPSWFNDPPASIRGKAIKVEFWRTGCPHCINAIPKLNETANRFGEDLVIVAITHENADQVRRGLQQRNVNPDEVQYPIGLDPQRRTAQQVGVRGVPHSLLMSSDGIVRWQGHPAALNDDTLQQILHANNAMFARTQLDERRWTKN